MHVQKTIPDAALMALLPGCSFADSYSLTVNDPRLDAVQAARRIGRMPLLVQGLMLVRHILVLPFGLKVGRHVTAGRRWIGPFPVVSESPDRVVLGFDDKHLDFLIVVVVAPANERTRLVSLTTLVRTHNRFGRLYLDAVLPFHRRIVPAMLAQVADPR